jgi:hypothetical protein
MELSCSCHIEVSVSHLFSSTSNVQAAAGSGLGRVPYVHCESIHQGRENDAGGHQAVHHGEHEGAHHRLAVSTRAYGCRERVEQPCSHTLDSYICNQGWARVA